MKKVLFFILISAFVGACAKVDPLEELLSKKNAEISGVWVWVNTKYPTPFGEITVSSLKNGIIYQVLISGKNCEVFRDDYLVQKFTFEIRRSGTLYYLDILNKEEIDRSDIDMLGGRIVLDEKNLTLSFSNRAFKADMLLSRVEIF